jgi:TnpA family transposase
VRHPTYTALLELGKVQRTLFVISSASLTFIQTLMIQEVLSEPAWMNQKTNEDLRGLTPLIYGNVKPYGLIGLNMAERLTVERAEAA